MLNDLGQMEFLYVFDEDGGNGKVNNLVAFNFLGQIVHVKIGENLSDEARREALAGAGIEMPEPVEVDESVWANAFGGV